MGSQKSTKIRGRIIDSSRHFDIIEVSKILEMKPNRLREWIRLGYILPDIKAPSAGVGNKNLFEKESIYKIALYKKLLDLRLHRLLSMEISQQFSNEEWYNIADRALHPTDPEELYMVVSANIISRDNWKEEVKIEMASTPNVALKDLDVSLVVNISKITKNVSKKIA